MKINVNLPELKGSAKQIAWAEDSDDRRLLRH